MVLDRPRKEKKILLPNSVHTRPRQENFEKNRKKLKKFKNLFPTLFLAKPGSDRSRKRKKKFTSEFRSKLDSGKKILKKLQKN